MARPLPSASTSSPSVSVTATSPALWENRIRAADSRSAETARTTSVPVTTTFGLLPVAEESKAAPSVPLRVTPGTLSSATVPLALPTTLRAVEGQVGGAVAEPDDGAGPVAEQQPDVRGGEVDRGAGLLDADVAGERLARRPRR